MGGLCGGARDSPSSNAGDHGATARSRAVKGAKEACCTRAGPEAAQRLVSWQLSGELSPADASALAP